MHPATRTLALILPCAFAALATFSVVTGTDAAEPAVAASAGVNATTTQTAYTTCRDQHQPSPASAAQVQRARQHHRDPNGRSQRPAWVQQAQGDIERCLRGAPDTALAASEPARYARR
jgi:hypothetical protein